LYADVGVNEGDDPYLTTITMERSITDFVSTATRDTTLAASSFLTVSIILDMSIEDWSPALEATIVVDMASLLGVPAADVVFVGVKPASVSVTLIVFSSNAANLANILTSIMDCDATDTDTLSVECQSWGSSSVLSLAVADDFITVEVTLGPQPKGPFYLDRSFFLQNFTRFFDAEQPDASFILNGASNGTYIFRPCFHLPPDFSGNISKLEEYCTPNSRSYIPSRCPEQRPSIPPTRPGWELRWSERFNEWHWASEVAINHSANGSIGATMVPSNASWDAVWDDPGDQDACPELCVWRDVKQHENNPPSIDIAFDDPCFLMYPPDPDEGILALFAMVRTDSDETAVVSVSMEKSVAWTWHQNHNVELMAEYGRNGSGYSARALVDTGSTKTGLDVRSYLGVNNRPGLDVYDGQRSFSSEYNQVGEICEPAASLVPPPPPIAWGRNMWVRDEKPYYEINDNASLVLNVTGYEFATSCADPETPCLNGGECIDVLPGLNPLQFEDHKLCHCPFEYGGAWCETERFSEFDESMEFAVNVYNVTLKADVPRNGRSVRWSEFLVWDSNECMIANGGCGHPISAYCENRCGELPLCHRTDGTISVGPNATAMEILIETFEGFKIEFSAEHRNRLNIWNEEQAVAWRAEMEAMLHPELANHSSSFNATFFQLNNVTWINVTGDDRGRRRLQIGLSDVSDVTDSADDLATDGANAAGDGANSGVQAGNVAYDTTGQLVAENVFNASDPRFLGYTSVDEFCADHVLDANSTDFVINVCNTTDPVYAVFEGIEWVDASDQLCRGRDAMTTDFVLQSNLINPLEHCSNPWVPDVCVGEGKTWMYTMRMSQQPASNVTMTVSGLFLQTNVSVVFTPWDFDQPHNVTVHMKENMAITGHYWMEMEHVFTGGVDPDGHDPDGFVEELQMQPEGSRTPHNVFTPNQVQWERSHRRYGNGDFTCTNRSHYHCGNEDFAWSHSRPPHTHLKHEVSGWVPGRLWSDTTNSFYPLKLPVLVLDNDLYHLNIIDVQGEEKNLGEDGRLWKVDTRIQRNQPQWRGPFTLGPSFFSANTARCEGDTAGTDACLDGPGWDLKKKELTTATTAWPPAPPLIAKCNIDGSDCSSTGEDPGFWTHDAQFGLQDVSFRMYGPFGSVEEIPLKRPQSMLFAFRPCYIHPPGLPEDFYELNGIECPSDSGYHLELADGEEPPPYPLMYEGPSGEVEPGKCLCSDDGFNVSDQLGMNF
jgi:hypothetical protein